MDFPVGLHCRTPTGARMGAALQVVAADLTGKGMRKGDVQYSLEAERAQLDTSYFAFPASPWNVH